MTVSETMVERALDAYEAELRKLYNNNLAEPISVSEIRSRCIRAALTAALSDQAGGWQDISTAPKINGVYVDLWMPKLSGEYGRVPDCKWLGNERQPGWYAESDDGAYYVGDRATHWMYRPEFPPPSSTPGGSQSG